MATEVLLYLVLVLLIMQVVFIGIVINLQMKHKRMQAKYQIFMRGKDGKSLEKGFLEQLYVMMHFRKWEEISVLF